MDADERAYNDLCNDIAGQTYKEAFREIEEVYSEKIKKLENDLFKYKAESERLKQKNEQLRQTLDKCNPYRRDKSECVFCGTICHAHYAGCEYFKLLKGDEDGI